MTESGDAARTGAGSGPAPPDADPAGGVAGPGYRWYLAAQVLSLFGTMMSYTALFWLALHIRYGGAPALAAAFRCCGAG